MHIFQLANIRGMGKHAGKVLFRHITALDIYKLMIDVTMQLF